MKIKSRRSAFRARAGFYAVVKALFKLRLRYSTFSSHNRRGRRLLLARTADLLEARKVVLSHKAALLPTGSRRKLSAPLFTDAFPVAAEDLRSGNDPFPSFQSSKAAGNRQVMDGTDRLALRAKRFSSLSTGPSEAGGPTLPELRERSGGGEGVPVYGSSQEVEKSYLRLTSTPAARNVRPPRVLKAALTRLLDLWQQGASYEYACEQLKAMRQDLTVQHVRGQLAVEVYEAHARIALQAGDWAEFRSCQNVLRGLHAEGDYVNAMEFSSYGVLFALRQGGELLASELCTLAPQALGELPLSRCLLVCRAVCGGDHITFWKLYRQLPAISRPLLAPLVDAMRQRAYRTVLRAFLPTLPLQQLALHLGLDSAQQAADYASGQAGGVVDRQQGVLDVKASRAALLGTK